MNLEEKVTGDPHWFETMMCEQLDAVAETMYGGDHLVGEEPVGDFVDVGDKYGQKSYEATRVRHFATLYVLCLFVKEVLEEIDELNIASKKYFAPHEA